MNKIRTLFDTSPLITLATFKVEDRPVIETVSTAVDMYVVQTVADEGTANPKHIDAQVISRMFNGQNITPMSVPVSSMETVIDGYTKLGKGERDTIKAALYSTPFVEHTVTKLRELQNDTNNLT
jgi:hypothetical protein